MTYEEAKAYREKLEGKNNVDSDKLKTFEKSANGLTPDHVRTLPQWQEAKNTFDCSFSELRNFNGWYVKTFKKEIAADRSKRYATK